MSAVDTEAAAVWERLLDGWKQRADSLRAQARKAPARTAADRGVILALHHEADALDACRTELAMTLAGFQGIAPPARLRRRVAAHGRKAVPR